MKTYLILAALFVSMSTFASTPYKVLKDKFGGENEVILLGMTGDLFATHELQSSRGPKWKKVAEAYIEERTEAVEISQKIEDYSVAESCRIRGEVDYIETDSLSYRWKALKPARTQNAQTVLYVVETYADYQVNFASGKTFRCPYLINQYVFLNSPSGRAPFTFLGKIKD